MIPKIIVNIILAINTFIYSLETSTYPQNINYQIIVILLSINLVMYMRYLIKAKNERLLIINIVYMCIVTYIYPQFLINLLFIVMEYSQLKCRQGIYGLVLIYVMMCIRFDLNYTNIFLGIISGLFIYESTRYELKLSKLEKINYSLKEKNYSLEEKIEKDSKLSYQSIETIKTEERNMISQKLHDKIGHTLAGSIMQLEALKIIIEKDKEKGFDMLEAIITNLRSGMDDIRQTLRKIKPEQSKININNLKSMIDDFEIKTDMSTSLSSEGDLNEINLIYWKALIECSNEVLTNTIKHSNGNHLSISISVLNKIIRLHIKDNGCYTEKIKKGMGLCGIEERIINMGGDVYFDNQDGFLTLIVLKR